MEKREVNRWKPDMNYHSWFLLQLKADMNTSLFASDFVAPPSFSSNLTWIMKLIYPFDRYPLPLSVSLSRKISILQRRTATPQVLFRKRRLQLDLKRLLNLLRTLRLIENGLINKWSHFTKFASYTTLQHWAKYNIWNVYCKSTLYIGSALPYLTFYRT